MFREENLGAADSAIPPGHLLPVDMWCLELGRMLWGWKVSVFGVSS